MKSLENFFDQQPTSQLLSPQEERKRILVATREQVNRGFVYGNLMGDEFKKMRFFTFLHRSRRAWKMHRSK